MRSVVFAYHDIGVVCLRALLDCGADVPAVFTHDDDPGETIWFRSVRQAAGARGIPVFAPEQVNTPEWSERIRSWVPDFIFSFYYRRLLGAELLAIPSRGALNLHGSLLPRYRGRCPVNWVLIHGERETGVTLHYMEVKPDRGDIVAQRAVPIGDDDTALTLFHKLTDAADRLLRETYPLLRAGRAPRVPQDHRRASYFGGRTPEHGRIDWAQSATQIRNLIRAVTHPYPGAFAVWQGRKLLVWEAQRVDTAPLGAPGEVVGVDGALVVRTGDGALRIVCAQWEGEPEAAGAECAQRAGIREGVVLT
jgi:methionyl-tRNA formyltransferase